MLTVRTVTTLSGSLFHMSVTLSVKKIVLQIVTALLFLQLKCVASHTSLPLHVGEGAANLLQLEHILEHLSHVPSCSSVRHAWNFNPSQSLLVAKIMLMQDNFCSSS